MKTLIVMRHGEAMPLLPGQQDADRSLTKAGTMALEVRLPHMLGLLKARGRTAELWTSRATRARQTAELLEKALKGRRITLKNGIEELDSLWKQDIDEFVADLFATEAKLVFAVGHIPLIEDVVEELTDSTLSFSPGSLGCLEVNLDDMDARDVFSFDDSARLLWFVQGPDVEPWEPLAQLQKALTKTAEVIEGRREAFFANPSDIETIHRFRTNTRTLRSLVAFIKPWQKAKENAELQTTLRDIVRHTSRLRELDVFEKHARSNPDSSPELLAFCSREASAERAKVLQILRSKKVAKSFEKAMAVAKAVTWKRRIAKGGLSKDAIRARFDSMVESVSADLATVRLADAEHTHDVRKRAKRVRYVSELNEDILGADAVDIAKGMTAHQDNLGAVCDARANIRLINEFMQSPLTGTVAWELALMRAQNETFLFDALKANEAREFAQP